jgi:3-deoxy-7-phosphoheptulonate synthase
VLYPDRDAVRDAVARLRELPPLVTSFEIERLKAHIAEAQAGKRFLLWGGDCAEQIDQCRPGPITSQLKILLQMSVVLVYAAQQPVIRVGRIAGQYAKPRSSATETRMLDDRAVTLPSYFGDLVNGAPFEPAARQPDPRRMLDGHAHAAMTLNFIRSLLEGGFADLHHPEYWDLGFMHHAGLPEHLRLEYEQMTRRLADGLKFMEAIGERSVDQLTRVEFFSSHEALNLLYDSAQTRTVPRRKGYYNLSTHLPWLGERTRDLSGAHVEYFRGIRNPIGVKLGPSVTPEQALALVQTLNPQAEPGRVVLITRMGAGKVNDKLPALIESVHNAQRAGKIGPVLWVSDPMHGNTLSLPSGVKTRSFEHVLSELNATWDVFRDLRERHADPTLRLGGVHIELTGEDVTECLGGARGLEEADLARNYASPCDPRLNYEQALELSFGLARRMTSG